MKILFLLFFVNTIVFANNSNDTNIDISIQTEDLELLQTSLELIEVNTEEFLLSREQVLNFSELFRLEQSKLLGDKEGNGGDYRLARIATDLYYYLLNEKPNDIIYFSPLIKKIKLLHTKNFCFMLSHSIVLINFNCFQKLNTKEQKNSFFQALTNEFIKSNPFSYSNSIINLRNCENNEERILMLPRPSDYINIYLNNHYGVMGLFNFHYNIQISRNNMPQIKLTDDELFDNKIHHVCALYKQDHILFNKKCWTQASSSERLTLVFHEIMRSLKINDDDYLQTLKFLNRGNCQNIWSQYRFVSVSK